MYGEQDKPRIREAPTCTEINLEGPQTRKMCGCFRGDGSRGGVGCDPSLHKIPVFVAALLLTELYTGHSPALHYPMLILELSKT